MKSTKTQKMVLAAMLAALGMILNLIEIPYPFAPWLNLDLSEIVVLVAISTLGFVPALFVCDWTNCGTYCLTFNLCNVFITCT